MAVIVVTVLLKPVLPDSDHYYRTRPVFDSLVAVLGACGEHAVSTRGTATHGRLSVLCGCVKKKPTLFATVHLHYVGRKRLLPANKHC